MCIFIDFYPSIPTLIPTCFCMETIAILRFLMMVFHFHRESREERSSHVKMLHVDFSRNGWLWNRTCWTFNTMALNLAQQTLFAITESCWEVCYLSACLNQAGSNHGNEVHIMISDNFDSGIIARILLYGYKRGVSPFSTSIVA